MREFTPPKKPQKPVEKFELVKASKCRPCDDDFDVLDIEGKVIGRIFRALQSPQYQPWAWMVTARAQPRSTDRGNAGSSEHAMMAFRRALKISSL